MEMAATAHLTVVAPDNERCTHPPPERRRRHRHVRSQHTRRKPQGAKYECESASIGAASLWRQSDDTVASRWSGAGRSGADGSRCYHAGAPRRPGGVLAGHRVERDGDLQRCDLQSGSRHQMPPPSPLITPPALLMMVPLFVLIAAAPLPAKVVNVPGVHDVIDAVAAAAA